MPLILHSQNVSIHDIAEFTLPKLFVDELLEVSSGTLIQGRLKVTRPSFTAFINHAVARE